MIVFSEDEFNDIDLGTMLTTISIPDIWRYENI